MTALLIGLGSALDSVNTLTTRSLFILMGSFLPLLVYWIAKAITSPNIGFNYNFDTKQLDNGS